MPKKSIVLSALKILGLEEMLKLSEVIENKQKPHYGVVDEEIIVWDDGAKDDENNKGSPLEKIILFPEKTVSSIDLVGPKEDPVIPDNSSGLLHLDLILRQREILKKHNEESFQKNEAISEYRKTNAAHIVRVSTSGGKHVVRSIATNGILINKKQA